MALAHSIGNKAEAAYGRGDMLDKRLRLMVDGAKYFASDGAAATVTLIRRTAA